MLMNIRISRSLAKENRVKKKLFVLAGALMMTWGALELRAQTSPPECWGVRCMACPPGQQWSPIVGNCCRCV
jgi:hypothetical protein